MAGLNNVEIDKSSWLKWEIALAVGAPVALGVGYWYFVRKNKGDPPPKIIKCESDTNISSSAANQPCKQNAENSLPENEVNKSSTTQVQSEAPVKKETPLDKAIALKTSGNGFFKNKSYEDAIRCYTEAIEICPENEHSTLSTFYQNRAAAYEHMQNFDGVINDSSAALKLDPKYMKALQRRAKAYEQKGKLVECLEDTTALCILGGFKNEHTLLMADRILQQIGKNDAQEIAKSQRPVLLSKHFVKTYFNSFDNDPITKNLKLEVNGHSEQENDVRGLEKAKRCLARGDYEDVIPACNEELETNEKSWETLLLRATMLFLIGEQKKALDDFDAIINGDCPDVTIKSNALVKRASLNLQLETPEISAADRFNVQMRPESFVPEKCMKDFAAAEKLDPDNSDIYHHRGQVNLLMDKMDSALEDMKIALEKNPDVPLVLVQMYYAQYRVASANKDISTVNHTIELFKEVMKKYPNCTEAYSLFIQICTDQLDFEQADEYFKKAIKADPSNATVRVQRATLHLQWKGDIQKAIELIEEAIRLDERCEYGYETLGTIEVQRGNLTRAVTLFEKALLYAKSERELAHICSLRNAAKAQAVVAERLGLPSVYKPS